MMDQKVFVIKTFCHSGGSCVDVDRQYGQDFFYVAPLRDSIGWIIKSLKKQEVCVRNA
jgi:hypothetical protein